MKTRQLSLVIDNAQVRNVNSRKVCQWCVMGLAASLHAPIRTARSKDAYVPSDEPRGVRNKD
jgi:hypothetical protein